MLLPVKEAAEALGVSVSGVRRGLKSGRLTGQRRATPQGHVWLIEVPDDQAVTTRTPATRVPGDRPPTRVADYPDDAPSSSKLDGSGDAPQEPPGGALLADRAAEMARYSRELLAPVLARLEAQATEIGVLTERTAHLLADLEGAKARIAELEAPPAPETETETESAPSPGWEARRWWQRLLWG